MMVLSRFGWIARSYELQGHASITALAPESCQVLAADLGNPFHPSAPQFNHSQYCRYCSVHRELLSIRRGARTVLWVLELHHSYVVLARVNEPSHPGEPDIGNAVFGLQPWQVVVFDLHATPA
jgi:hypothetical protein